MIGHSLGAHSAAHLGRQYALKTGQKVARISGLEPARPYFYPFDMKDTLTPDDAEFVDVIHTNSGPLQDVSAILTLM